MAATKRKEKAEKSDKLSVQARFDQFIDYVKMALDERGRRLLYTNSQWHEYRSGYWTPWGTAEREAFNSFLYKLASLHEFSFSTQRSAIWATLEAALGSEDVVRFDGRPMIVCNSGTYFVADNKMRKHAPDHFATRRVALDVDPKAECPKWLSMLDRMFDDYSDESRAETIQFLQEWMGVAIVGGASVTSSRDMRKGLFLYGEKRTGKSSISDVLIRLLGGLDRVATPSLTSLSGRFGLEPLIGKAALVTSEAADSRTTADSNVLKNLITGDPVQVDRKGLQPVAFQWNGPVLFTTNNLPKIEDETDALYDRCVIIEFTRQFSPEDVALTLEGYPNAIKYLEGTGQLPGILNWCLDGYDAAVERGRLSVPATASSATERFRRRNDRVFDFLKTCCKFDPKSACAAAALSIACREFSLSRHDTVLSLDTAARGIARSIRAAVPGVVAEQGYHDKQQFRAYSKLRLNSDGMAFLEMALSKPYPGIKRTMALTNYRYG